MQLFSVLSILLVTLLWNEVWSALESHYYKVHKHTEMVPRVINDGIEFETRDKYQCAQR